VASFIERPSTPDFDSPATDHLPAFLNIDAGLGYNRTFGNVELGALLQVSNVLNRRNIIDRSLLPATYGYDMRPRTLPGRLPTLSLTVSY